MKYIRCTLRFSESTIHPVHQFIEEHDAMVKDQLLHGNITREEWDTFLFYGEGDANAYAAALARIPQIIEYEVTRIDTSETERGDETIPENGDGAGNQAGEIYEGSEEGTTSSSRGSFYAYVKQEPSDIDAQLFDAFTRSGVIVVPPIDFLSDGTARVTVVGEPDALQSSLAAVPEGVRLAVERVGEYEGGAAFDPGLTDRQFEASVAAVETGYYEIPREGSVAAIARELGCSSGTASEHLRKAERKIMESVVTHMNPHMNPGSHAH